MPMYSVEIMSRQPANMEVLYQVLVAWLFVFPYVCLQFFFTSIQLKDLNTHYSSKWPLVLNEFENSLNSLAKTSEQVLFFC